MRYLVRRLALALLTLWLVVTITFFVSRAVPGGPFHSDKALSPEALAALNTKFGLDQPVMTQYLLYLKNLVTAGDFGPSLTLKGKDVATIIQAGLKTSLLIGSIAMAIALSLGICLGVVSAVRHGKLLDHAITTLTTTAISMPSFVVGTLLLLIFSLWLGLLPANGATPAGLILPTLTLALYPTAHITRLTRASMLDVLGQDYIRTAYAKGLTHRQVLFGHALKNALIPVVTYAGPMLAYILTGSLVVEQIFAIPGLGRYFVSGIVGRDYPLIMGTTITLACLVIVANLAADLICQKLDPRIKFT